MILFGLGALALAGLATALILPALLNRRPVNRDDRARQNIRIARRRLEEMAGELDASGNADGDVETRAEIEAALLDDLPEDETDPSPPPKNPGKVWTVLILGMIPLLSTGLYLVLGTPDALRPGTLTAAPQNPAPEKAPPVEVLVRQLEEKLAANPGSAEGWALAGRTYMGLSRFTDAERAYQILHQLVGDDPHVLTAWADAALMANNGAFSPQIRARLERALEIRPEHDNALWLAALEAEARQDYRRALKYLERLLPLLEGRDRDAAEVQEFIARMRGLTQSPKDGAGAGSLKVHVSLDPKLAGTIRDDHRVYVFAKAVNGPSMPLAVSRHRASELPITITLDDSMAMIEGIKISDFERVSVMARLSRSGDPIARAGDIESAAVVTRTNAQSPPELVIDRVVGAGQ